RRSIGSRRNCDADVRLRLEPQQTLTDNSVQMHGLLACEANPVSSAAPTETCSSGLEPRRSFDLEHRVGRPRLTAHSFLGALLAGMRAQPWRPSPSLATLLSRGSVQSTSVKFSSPR